MWRIANGLEVTVEDIEGSWGKGQVLVHKPFSLPPPPTVEVKPQSEPVPTEVPEPDEVEGKPPLQQEIAQRYKERLRAGSPTIAEDEAWGKTIGLPRERVRELRRAHRTPEAKKGGRRRK
jgi:hypothetical protein